MALTESEQAVLDHLVAELGPVLRTGPPTPSRWRSQVRGGGGAGADPATVRFRRCREFPNCQLHAVAFSTHQGHPREMVVRTMREPDGGWLVAPIGRGDGDHPPRPRPWVNFTAQWNAEEFAGGGDVIGTGAERAHLVRLTFPDGTAVDDDARTGVVLFFIPHGVSFPARVEILDERGTALAAYEEFAWFT